MSIVCSIEAHNIDSIRSTYCINTDKRSISNWIIPRTASATRALLRLSPCYRAYLRPSVWRNFGYSRLPWIDGRWVQDLRTYSPRYVWPAITSDSGFMRSSCRPQSELAPPLLGLAQGYPVATRCSGDCIMCVAQDIKGTCWPGVILSFLPDRNKQLLIYKVITYFGLGSLVWHL